MFMNIPCLTVILVLKSIPICIGCMMLFRISNDSLPLHKCHFLFSVQEIMFTPQPAFTIHTVLDWLGEKVYGVVNVCRQVLGQNSQSRYGDNDSYKVLGNCYQFLDRDIRITLYAFLALCTFQLSNIEQSYLVLVLHPAVENNAVELCFKF